MNSKFSVSGDSTGNVHIRKLYNDDEFDVKFTQKGPVSNLLFSPDGASLFTSSTDHLVTEWNVENGEKLREIVGEEGSVITSLA